MLLFLLFVAFAPLCSPFWSPAMRPRRSVSLVRRNALPFDLTSALASSGAAAKSSLAQVTLLMWTRTVLNYQYRNGVDFSTAFDTLVEEGGIRRLYSGLPFALVQVPTSRFCDVLANEFAQQLSFPLPIKSFAGSSIAACFRVAVTPIDTLKTTMQVSGPGALSKIVDEVREDGIERLFRGGLGNAGASIIGHYPFFLTYNFLTDYIPETARSPGAEDGLLAFLIWRGLVGVGASCVSDVVSNTVRVLKTYRQTSPEKVTYGEAFGIMLEEEGGDVVALATRGLRTRLSINALQSGIFSIGWKYFQSVSSK